MTEGELHDELVLTFTCDGSASLRVLLATNLVREAARRHRTTPTASVALGRALMGTLLLASEMQDRERVQLQIRGDGPLGRITVTAESDATVRGYVQHPSANPPLEGDELGVAGGIGTGLLMVERHHPSWRQPYQGIVPLATGEVAQDLANYLLESEQKRSALALGIYLSPRGEIEAAVGYLVQGLPGAADDVLTLLERGVGQTLHPSNLVRAGASADAILHRLLGDVAHDDIERREPRFQCPCGPSRVLRAVALLGDAEMRSIVRDHEVLEVRCAFCAEEYRVLPDELGELLQDA